MWKAVIRTDTLAPRDGYPVPQLWGTRSYALVCSFEVCKSLTAILTLLGDVGLRIGPTRGLSVDGSISPRRRKKEERKKKESTKRHWPTKSSSSLTTHALELVVDLRTVLHNGDSSLSDDNWNNAQNNNNTMKRHVIELLKVSPQDINTHSLLPLFLPSQRTCKYTPQPFYGPFSNTTRRVSQCQERTSGLYDKLYSPYNGSIIKIVKKKLN